MLSPWTAAALAQAAPGASPSAPASPAGPVAAPGQTTEFRAVEGGAEARSGEVLLVEAYAVLWIILMGWILLVWRKQASLHARLDALEREIDKAAEKGAAR